VSGPSAIDRRRLRDGAAASGLGEPQTREEVKEQLQQLADGIRAMQSLDDLGPEENARVWSEMTALGKKYDQLKVKLAGMP
jgi:hypothetical protein